MAKRHEYKSCHLQLIHKMWNLKAKFSMESAPPPYFTFACLEIDCPISPANIAGSTLHIMCKIHAMNIKHPCQNLEVQTIYYFNTYVGFDIWEFLKWFMINGSIDKLIYWSMLLQAFTSQFLNKSMKNAMYMKTSI